MVSADEAPLPFLIAWAPVWKGRACLDECLRYLVATRLAVDGPRGSSGRAMVVSEKGLDMGGFILPTERRLEL